MSFREQLHAYIAKLEQRLRWSALLRGLAILTGSALVATLVLVTIANALAFSNGSVTGARFGLILILAIAAVAGLALPLRRLTRRRAVGTVESAFPQFQQRLTTFTERDGPDPFIELLAGNTLEVAQSAQPQQVVTDRRLWISLATGAGAIALLVWIIAAGPGFLGYGASLLWTGPHHDKPALYDLRVTPGDAVVRRHADQVVSALPTGLRSPSVKLYARFQNSSKWEEIAMLPTATGSFAGGYQFAFAGLPDSVEYYVTAGAMTSKHFNIRVTDLPAVKQIRVTYHYPTWTGLPSEVEERGGDLRAVTGTEAELDVTTDRPLQGGQILLDSGQKIELAGGQNNVYHGTLKMDQDGVYHVAGVDDGQPVRVSEDFFIEARKANPPQISLVHPRGDYRALPIEEVTLSAKASDEYGLKGVDLHYSVNGGPEVTVDLLKQKGAKQADGSTTLSLEDFKLVPGDVISVYATAKDANADAHTDIVFIQTEPYEREFSQSQQGGGGGGGGGGQGDQPAQISQREKEIISATFKQQGDKNTTQQQADEVSKLLSQSQATLHDQSVTLAGRLEARELTDEVQAISDFQKDMIAASQAMAPAAQQLQQQKWKDAVPNEQKALQFLLRAEATYRQIQVAFLGARGKAVAEAAVEAARRAIWPLSSILSSTPRKINTRLQQSSSASFRGEKAQEIDDALKKLRRAGQARGESGPAAAQWHPQTAEQKWQQGDVAARGSAAPATDGAAAWSTRAKQPAGSARANRANRGNKASRASRVARALRRPGKPADRRAKVEGDRAIPAGTTQQSAGNPGRRQPATSGPAGARPRASGQRGHAARRCRRVMPVRPDSRRAADRLREATDLLGGQQQQDASGRLDSLAKEADQLTDQQKQQADRVRDLIAQQNAARAGGKQPRSITAQEVDKMVNDRQKGGRG